MLILKQAWIKLLLMRIKCNDTLVALWFCKTFNYLYENELINHCHLFIYGTVYLIDYVQEKRFSHNE